MPVAGQRDPAAVKATLEPWLASHLPDATDVEITDLVVPQASGFSNETFLIDARWVTADGPVDAELVLRSQPQEYALFPEIDLIAQQYRTMALLGEHSDVPVARVRWAEPDPGVLGQPFFVMDRLHGQVPGDRPPYTMEGFVMDMDPATRREWHTNGVEAMTRVGRVDWRRAGFDYLDQRHHGPLGPTQRLNYFRQYLAWATRHPDGGGERHPIAHPAFEWLEANWPDDGDHVELCWGDARPGNQMYDGTEVVGVFDWEMVSLGNAESDLGWWLFLQRYSTDGVGAPLPEGMLDRDDTIACWEQHMGRRATHVDFYERLGGFHFTLVMIKLTEMMVLLSDEPVDPTMSVHNPVAAITADLIGIPLPGM